WAGYPVAPALVRAYLAEIAQSWEQFAGMLTGRGDDGGNASESQGALPSTAGHAGGGGQHATRRGNEAGGGAREDGDGWGEGREGRGWVRGGGICGSRVARLACGLRWRGRVGASGGIASTRSYVSPWRWGWGCSQATPRIRRTTRRMRLATSWSAAWVWWAAN